jgi:transcriptional regulator with XRE-family HTH domain
MRLKAARLARNLTIQDVAQSIGAGPRAISDAEAGKPGVGASVLVALLWVYDLLSRGHFRSRHRDANRDRREPVANAIDITGESDRGAQAGCARRLRGSASVNAGV